MTILKLAVWKAAMTILKLAVWKGGLPPLFLRFVFIKSSGGKPPFQTVILRSALVFLNSRLCHCLW